MVLICWFIPSTQKPRLTYPSRLSSSTAFWIASSLSLKADTSYGQLASSPSAFWTVVWTDASFRVLACSTDTELANSRTNWTCLLSALLCRERSSPPLARCCAFLKCSSYVPTNDSHLSGKPLAMRACTSFRWPLRRTDTSDISRIWRFVCVNVRTLSMRLTAYGYTLFASFATLLMAWGTGKLSQIRLRVSLNSAMTWASKLTARSRAPPADLILLMVKSKPEIVTCFRWTSEIQAV